MMLCRGTEDGVAGGASAGKKLVKMLWDCWGGLIEVIRCLSLSDIFI